MRNDMIKKRISFENETVSQEAYIQFLESQLEQTLVDVNKTSVKKTLSQEGLFDFFLKKKR